jgi:Svf1-like N-terminal lipocalin domain
VAGTQEPIYGSSAIQPVTEQAKTVPFTEITANEEQWETPETSCVETQTFYIFTETGRIGFVQVIYSNVA